MTFFVYLCYKNRKMVYSKFHFLLGHYKLVDKSIYLSDWQTAVSSFRKKNESVIFLLELRNKLITFDIHFDINGTCSWDIEDGDYLQPSYFEQNDIELDIKIGSIYSENDIDLDINDLEVNKLLTDLIKNNL